MIDRINKLFSSLAMTVVSGIALVASFILRYNNLPAPFDPVWIAVVISGLPLLYISIWRLIYNAGIKKISSALLISMAMLAAIAIGDLFAAGEVAFIMMLGGILEEMTIERAQRGLKKLIQITPSMAHCIVDGKVQSIDYQDIKVDDVIRILPGEIVPVDGVVLKGESAIDQSLLTGESLPIDKETGDEVFSGTLNQFGTLDIRATKVGQDSTLQKLIQIIKLAEDKQAPMQRIADVAASWLVPIALLIAIAVYFITNDVVRGVTILVVFCPCSLVLATPTAVMAAIGQAGKHGVIIKSGEALEKMNAVNTIVFDKTGTLTHAKLTISDVISFDSALSQDDLLKMAGAAEQNSEHPLAKAIVEHCYAKKLALKPVENFAMTAGRGICATLNDKTIHCGNLRYIKEQTIAVDKGVAAQLDALNHQGKATVIVAADGQLCGAIALTDSIRSASIDTIEQLHKQQIETVLLTGDKTATANYFAQKANIGSVYAELTPSEKMYKIDELTQSGQSVCMIGDGINDAPSLKSATVGVAMGGIGSDLSVDASDVVLMSDNIDKVLYLKWLAGQTVSTIKFSIMLSMTINFVAIILSGLGYLTPTSGALVHNGGSVFVVLIAALLYDRKYTPASL